MAKKRFLRDSLLDEMLEEIRVISEKTAENGLPTMIFSNALLSLTDLYETNKSVLIRLEEVIEQLRKRKVDKEIIHRIVEATVQIQRGLVTVHNALKSDVQSLLEGIESLQKKLDT